MKREELIVTVISMISQEVEVPVDNIELGMELADLNIDSLDVLKLAAAFEKSFNITISTAELMQIKTVGDIITGLERQVVS